MSRHTVHFLCPVNQSTISWLQDRCLTAIHSGATSIDLHLSSSGGDLIAGFTAYHFLKSLPVPVRTHNLSNVESIANVIFLAGKERYANPGSRFLFHPLHWSFPAPLADHARVSEWTKCLDNDFERFVEIFNLATNLGNGMADCGDLIRSATIADSVMAENCGITHGTRTASLVGSAMNWWVTC
ncbi:ATP-dependent Clp protease proteolytic subunit [Chromobacterium haemolyticum]|uniref:ATP-dependent Clp protease proteolytic subunit n=1 Tax=Chromobacterium haemolyticum TaxID=394935 RepID=UPI004055B662